MATLHMGMTREFVAGLIRERGTEFFDPHYEGTNAEAIAEVLAGPPIIATCACPKMPDGACAGEDGWLLRQPAQVSSPA